MRFKDEDIVKSCSRIESGLRLGPDGIRACCFSVMVSPFYWTSDEAGKLNITKEMIIEKRKHLFEQLNDEHSDISCKHCLKVEKKRYADVGFEKLGFMDLAHYSTCNLRCTFCGFTQADNFEKAKYDALGILNQFSREEVEWDSCVDFNGGEPSLLKDLDKFIDYFRSHAVRTRLYSNALRFRQSIYDGMLDGTISWLIVSLDAGTPSTYKKLKKSDKFLKVVENLTRYASAGSQGKGMLAVKYIFSDGNCGEDDISGFVYLMLAIRPQKVYLGFDFFPLADKYAHQATAGVYDYSKHVDAYAKTFLLLKKHGLQAFHFSKSFLSVVVQEGRDLMQQTLQRIDELEAKNTIDEQLLHLVDFRNGDPLELDPPSYFVTHPLRLKNDSADEKPWPLTNKKVLIAPATPLSSSLLDDPSIRDSNFLGFLDRSSALQGKNVNGHLVYPYESISELSPDIILVASPFHQDDILNTLAKHNNGRIQIAALFHIE